MKDPMQVTSAYTRDFASEDLRVMAFEALLGLACKRGGPKLLGGAALAKDTFRRSLIGEAFPRYVLEASLIGEPGFDLHVCYERDQLIPGERFAAGAGFGMQALFDWYSEVETGGLGVEFAHDLRGGRRATGAYVNISNRPLEDLPGFFDALDAADVRDHATALLARLPGSWHPWYVGLFPERLGAGVRVGMYVSPGRQADYAHNVREIAADLRLAGFDALDGEMLSHIQTMAALPFQLELQLDATEDGTGDTLGVDLTLSLRSSARVQEAFAEGGAAAHACSLFVMWGISDGRWRHLASSSFGRFVPVRMAERGDVHLVMKCLPTFIKAKWSDARLQPAKVYLSCHACPIVGAIADKW